MDALTGARVASYRYGPFGEVLEASGERASSCPFRWQTKRYDEETGLYYFGLRYYDPRTQSWLSRDPIREAGGVNLYAYCQNDPVGHFDPLGLSQTDDDVDEDVKALRDLGLVGASEGWLVGHITKWIFGWGDRAQEKKNLAQIVQKSSVLSRDSATGPLAWVRRANETREHQLRMSIAEMDGLLPPGSADDQLASDTEDFDQIRAYNSVQRDIYRRELDAFSEGVGAALIFVPSPGKLAILRPDGVLRVKVPKILGDPSLSAKELEYLTAEFRIKANAIQAAAAQGKLVWSPGTDIVRIAELQNEYRDAVRARFLRRYSIEVDLRKLNADHPVDLIIGGSPTQRLKLLNESINKSVGSSLLQAGRRAKLKLGDPILEVIFEPR